MREQNHRSLYVEFGTISYWLTNGIFFLPFSFAFLMELLRVPGILKFSVDICWIGLLAIPLMRGRISFDKRLRSFALLTVLFVLDTFVVYLFRFQSIFYYLWGTRNYLRFYIAFFAFATYFREEDGIRCLEFMDKLFWLNAAIAIVQFLMGNEQDCIGGIFGAQKGCNGYLQIYFTVVISKSVLGYMNGEEKTFSCFSKCVAALCISAIAEVKFFFFVFIMILTLAMVLTSFSAKKVVLLFLGTVFISLGATLLTTLYDNFEGFLSVDTLVDALTRTNYASENDMGRFNAISVISKRFLKDTPSRLFGLGLGNCDTSSLDICNTRFYDIYNHLHYAIFSYSFMFMENGYVGLALYVLFFALCLGYALRQLKNPRVNPLFSQMSVIISTLCFVLLFYNSTLRIEAGFMIYFVLALPFIESNREPDIPDAPGACDTILKKGETP